MDRSEVLHLDIHVSSDEKDVKELVQRIRPSWNLEDIRLKSLSGGLVNFLWKVWCTSGDEDDMLTVKIFGAGGDALLDRNKGKLLMEALHKQGICAPLFAIYQNGFVYHFVQGSTLTAKQLLDPQINRLVVEKMHQIHSFQHPPALYEQDFDMGLFYVRRVISDWQTCSQDPHINDIIGKLGVSKENLMQEVQGLEECYKALCRDFPRCFCHFDMHVLNLVYNEGKDQIDVVDWEFAGPTVEVHEIAAHFMTDPDNRIHDAGILFSERTAEIKSFVRRYLSTRPNQNQDVDDQLVHKWFLGTYKAMYIIGMTNFAWGLCQPNKEGCDFMAFSVPQFNDAQKIKRMINNSQ